MGIDMVTPLFEPNRPSGWGASQDLSAVYGTLVYTILKCERISWGPFERGPIYLMQEWHTDFETPGKCAEGDYTQGAVMRLAWFSDPEIAEYAKETFGMPAAFAEISHNISTTGSIPIARWSWNLPGGAASEAFFRVDEAFMGTSEPDWRVFWDNGAGVSYMDMRDRYATPQEGLGDVYGKLAPPMLYGEGMPDDTFVTASQTDQITDGDFNADISRFSDYECEEPL